MARVDDRRVSGLSGVRAAAASVPRAVWWILALALFVRLATLAFIWSLGPATDAAVYQETASSLARGDGYPETIYPLNSPTALHPPGYPGLLVGPYLILGDSIHVGQLLGVLLGVVAVGLVGLITWQLFQDRRAALISLAIAAVYPPLIVMSTTVMSEALFIPLALAAIAATLHQRRVGGLPWAAIAGALAGLAMLTRLVGIVLIAMLALSVWTSKPRFSRRALAAPVLLAIVGALLFAPWSVRNTVVMDEFVPLGTQTGMMFAGIYNDISRADPRHEWRIPYEIPPYKEVFDRGLSGVPETNEAEQSSELSAIGRDYISDHPTYPLAVAFKNLQRTLELDPRSPSWLDAELMGFAGVLQASARVKLLFWASSASFLAILALSLPAIRRGAWRRIPVPLLLLPVLLLLTTVFVTGGMRYRVPTDFLLIGLAGVTLTSTRVGNAAGALLGDRRVQATPAGTSSSLT